MGALTVNLQVDDVFYTTASNYTNNNIVYSVDIVFIDSGQRRTFECNSPQKFEYSDSAFEYRVVVMNATSGYADVTPYNHIGPGWYDGALSANGTIEVCLGLKSKYQISYDANGGYGAPEAQIRLYGETISLSSDIPVRDGYVFVGWNTDADGYGQDYQPSSIYGEYTTILYAQWVRATRIYISQQGSVGACPYIYANGQWKQATRYIYITDSGWQT